jgi:hypothetical protein
VIAAGVAAGTAAAVIPLTTGDDACPSPCVTIQN